MFISRAEFDRSSDHLPKQLFRGDKNGLRWLNPPIIFRVVDVALEFLFGVDIACIEFQGSDVCDGAFE